MATEITWKDVFNGSLKNWGHISLAASAAVAAGYRYLFWNDHTYEIDERGNIKDLLLDAPHVL